MVDRQFIAIYIDLENVAGFLDLKTLMQDIILEENREDPEEYIFAVKFACGNSASITKLRTQLTNYNFAIREAPRVTGKKNRADLIISLDAFEKLYLEKPSIDRFVFVTSDSDFSIIMDMLRKYGKEVWLVTKEEDAQRGIFTNCTDNILTLPHKEKGRKPQAGKAAQKSFSPNEKMVKSAYAKKLFVQVLRNLDQNEEYLVNSIGNKMRQLDKSFKITKTSYKRFANLVKEVEQEGLIKIRKNQQGHLLISEINVPES